VEGLVKVVVVSLDYLVKQIDPEEIARYDKLPVLEISLDLYGKDVMFMPDIFETTNHTGVRDIVNNWVESFFHIATIFKRLDTNSGSYIKELQENMEVCALLAKLNETLAVTEGNCVDYRQRYKEYQYLWTTDLSTMFQEFIEGATVSVTESGRPVLDLRQFDESITKFRGVQTAVSELRTPIDIGWLRVNSQPIKQALGTWVTKWVFMYTQHLHDDVHTKLSALHHTITRVEAGLAEEVTADKKEALMRVRRFLRDVRMALDETQEMFAPLRDTVALLKQHNISLEGTFVEGAEEEVLEYLESAPLKWDSLVNNTFKKKEEILPLQNSEVENIKDELARFQLVMKNFRTDFRANAPFEFGGAVDQAYVLLDQYHEKLMEVDAHAKRLNELEELFELPISVYTETLDSRREMQLLKELWDFRSLVERTFDDWKTELWASIDTAALEERVRVLMKDIQLMGNTNSAVKGWKVYKRSLEKVKNMAIVLPLVNELHSPAMRDRHWKSLTSVCHSRPVDVKNPKFCLEDLLELQLYKHMDDVQEIVETAGKELKVDKKLQGIEETWTSLQLEFANHKDMEVRVVKPPDAVIEGLEVHQLDLQSMIGLGKFVDYFRDRVTQWQRTLGNVESVLKEWTAVTKQWMSLEAIFLASADIRNQLPDDTKRFEGIDQDFKNLMKEAVETPNVVESCMKQGRWELLRDMTAELEKCQKSLNEYLDMKKKIFPRFYFVSNVALLDILSNGNNPPMIMPHVGDCYDGMKELAFLEGSTVLATGMIAKDGETVAFPQQFEIRGAVEDWLNSLTRAMQDCLRSVLEQGVDTAVHWDVEKPRHQWLFDYPAQVVLQASQLFWTEEAEGALEEFEGGTEDAVSKCLAKCNSYLEDLINLVKTDLSKPDRTKVIALITLDVHGRDVVTRLVKERTEGPTSFLWQQQLRYYWDPESKDVDIRICDYKTKYSYEYIGNRDRLVITPLTDRCYITLTTALRLMLGGAPAGPAGTGKTETTKDLARALALPCYVFNCSDQMNYQTLADIFKGLSQTGGWGCFDEFNSH
jgi:dynein heavy chain